MTVPHPRVCPEVMLTLVQPHQVAALVLFDSTMLTTELLHFTANHVTETVQLALA